MKIQELIKVQISKALTKEAIAVPDFGLEHPEDSLHGDYSSNIAMMIAKSLGKKPVEVAQNIAEIINKNLPEEIKKVEVAGPGFINFFVAEKFVTQSVLAILAKGEKYGHSSDGSKRRVLVEYTDPNTFKVFHIGHLMSNSIGESIARLIESDGVDVVRVCYPSDIGLHIAKAIWAISQNLQDMPDSSAPIGIRTDFLGRMYVLGTKTYDENPEIKKEIDDLNKKIYDKSDDKINEIYEKGRKWSLDHFDLLYKILGTKFDKFIFESEMASIGLDVVKQNIGKVFELSDGATVFKGEEYGLHTRVFINSHGIPTYEAKDLGLNITKFKNYPDAIESIIITASEQNDYFRVIKKVLLLIDETNGNKTKHIGHGMMRFAEGKMSSRTGNVVTADALIEDIKELVKDKIKDRKLSKEDADEIANIVAVGAIKYTILRSAVGSNIVFDSASSISFEGDSGPYLQYSAVRAQSIIEKAKEEKIDLAETSPENIPTPSTVYPLEKMLVKFEEIVSRSRADLAPQTIASYLVALAGLFNSFYASQVIVDKNNPLSLYYVALTKAFLITMTNGLHLLGIKVPRRM
jgi:arginyl-tRNA synthetase